MTIFISQFFQFFRQYFIILIKVSIAVVREFYDQYTKEGDAGLPQLAFMGKGTFFKEKNDF